jgi:hypothetical protein
MAKARGRSERRDVCYSDVSWAMISDPLSPVSSDGCIDSALENDSGNSNSPLRQDRRLAAVSWLVFRKASGFSGKDRLTVGG